MNSSSHAFRHPPSRSVFDHSIRIELQINPPRLQQTTKPSADQASIRYHLCDCHRSLLPSSPLLPHHILYSLTTLDSYIRSVAAARWRVCFIACSRLTFLKHHCASLRIGLRCFHRSRCRVPARISICGKDFPHPFYVDSNQPFLISFFFFLPSYVLQHFILSALRAPLDLTSNRPSLLFPFYFYLFVRLFLGFPNDFDSQAH